VLQAGRIAAADHSRWSDRLWQVAADVLPFLLLHAVWAVHARHQRLLPKELLQAHPEPLVKQLQDTKTPCTCAPCGVGHQQEEAGA